MTPYPHTPDIGDSQDLDITDLRNVTNEKRYVDGMPQTIWGSEYGPILGYTLPKRESRGYVVPCIPVYHATA